MAKATVKQLKRDVEQLLKLADLHRQYMELQNTIKNSMVELGHSECEIKNLGRVFIKETERVTVSPKLAREVLKDMAERVIVVKESVPNSIIKAFVDAGEISEDQRDKLLEKAEKQPVISLYVRPLK